MVLHALVLVLYTVVLVLQILCCVGKHNLITLVVIMILEDTTAFQVLFLVSLFCAWNITIYILWRSTVAFIYLKVKAAKCLCLLPEVLVLLFWSWYWSCKQRSWSWSWSEEFGLVYIIVFVFVRPGMSRPAGTCPRCPRGAGDPSGLARTQWRRNRGSGGSMNRAPELMGPRIVGSQKNFRQDS